MQFDGGYVARYIQNKQVVQLAKTPTFLTEAPNIRKVMPLLEGEEKTERPMLFIAKDEKRESMTKLGA